MIGGHIRQGIVVVMAAGLVGAAVWLWQEQYAPDLPPAMQARPLDPPADAPVEAAKGPSRPPVDPYAGSGITPPARRARPSGSPGGWIADADYPLEAIRNEWQGTTGVVLDIGYAGLVEGCRVTSSSGYAVLDKASCTLLTGRARFDPARDAVGETARDRFATRISWRLPE